MLFLDLSLNSPEENLALDEALLNWCEAESRQEVLRFWESKQPFVVMGYSNKIQREVNISACKKKAIPVLRRASGGGTVVQGPGCLNYALVLSIDERPIKSIQKATEYILHKHASLLESLSGQPIRCRGISDLTLGELKFSGNAQRRKKTHLLFHGTFLLRFDLGLIHELLLTPEHQPDYRQNRSHEAFVTNLDCSEAALKKALCESWNAVERLKQIPDTEMAGLMAEKYGKIEWHQKF